MPVLEGEEVVVLEWDALAAAAVAAAVAAIVHLAAVDPGMFSHVIS